MTSLVSQSVSHPLKSRLSLYLLIAMISGTDSHGSQRMNPSDDSLTFPLAPSGG